MHKHTTATYIIQIHNQTNYVNISNFQASPYKNRSAYCNTDVVVFICRVEYQFSF